MRASDLDRGSFGHPYLPPNESVFGIDSISQLGAVQQDLESMNPSFRRWFEMPGSHTHQSVGTSRARLGLLPRSGHRGYDRGRKLQIGGSPSRVGWPLSLSLTTMLLATTGCSSTVVRSPGADIDELADTLNKTQLVEDLATPIGMNWLKVESVGLVFGLDGTGSDPGPSARRQVMMNEMRARRVDGPNEIMASPNTSLVLVRGYLPPGVRKGDRLDVELRVPSRSKTTSLRGGWLMPTRLKEMAVLNSRIASGHDLGLAQGHVLDDAAIYGVDDPIRLTRGRVVGGGVSSTTRSLGLAVRKKHHSVATSTRIGAAINARFHIFDRGEKVGVANPQRDSFVKLAIHPRYGENLVRYIRVIQSIPVRESPTDRVDRIDRLRQELHQPSSAARAAIRLEALGTEAEPTLRSALTSTDEEVRVYTAEALAYLGRADGVEILAKAARDLPAFRWFALQALGTMDDPQGYEALSSLLHVSSAETRYGAFRVLVEISPQDPLVAGEPMDDDFYLHHVASTGEPLVHIARYRRPEIVLFGNTHALQTPLVAFAGKRIVIKGDSPGSLTASRFASDESDLRESCSAELSKVIRTAVKLGATYTDVVKLIHQLKSNGNLTSRIAFDAVPRQGRTYHRDAADDEPTSGSQQTSGDEDWESLEDAPDLSIEDPI